MNNKVRAAAITTIDNLTDSELLTLNHIVREEIDPRTDHTGYSKWIYLFTVKNKACRLVDGPIKTLILDACIDRFINNKPHRHITKEIGHE